MNEFSVLSDNKLVRLSVNHKHANIRALAEKEIHRRLSGGVRLAKLEFNMWKIVGNDTVN